MSKIEVFIFPWNMFLSYPTFHRVIISSILFLRPKKLAASFVSFSISPYFRGINKIPNGSMFIICPESVQNTLPALTPTLAQSITISCLYSSFSCLLPNPQDLEVYMACSKLSFNSWELSEVGVVIICYYLFNILFAIWVQLSSFWYVVNSQ